MSEAAPTNDGAPPDGSKQFALCALGRFWVRCVCGIDSLRRVEFSGDRDLGLLGGEVGFEEMYPQPGQDFAAIPWPLSREEHGAFSAAGLDEIEFDDEAARPGRARSFVVVYARPTEQPTQPMCP